MDYRGFHDRAASCRGARSGALRRWAPGPFIMAACLAATTAARADSLWSRSALLGTAGGLRTTLGNDGITLGGTDTETLLGAIAGGVKQGATMQGVTTVTLQIDTGKAFNLTNGTFDVSALQIHGRSLSPYYLDDLQTASGTEADDATRLWELWYDQAFDHGRADFKIGQQSIDQEFITSKGSSLFVNTMAGWPLVPSADLYAGGPAYPLSSLGARLQFKPQANQTLLLGAFDDNPPGGPFGNDPQSRDAGGVRFNTNTGALVIGEFQYVTHQPAVGDMVGPAGTSELPGTYKIGFWFDTAAFPDQALASNGVSLASPQSSGIPLSRKHDFSLYAVADQTVWRSQAVKGRNVSLFARIMTAPGDRNLVGTSFNGGVTLTAPLPGRDDDTAGFDIGIGKLSAATRAYDRAIAIAQGRPDPIRTVETLLEATYQAQIAPWWQVQPTVQYIVNPAGGIPDPLNPARSLANELVIGIRTNVTF